MPEMPLPSRPTEITRVIDFIARDLAREIPGIFGRTSVLRVLSFPQFPKNSHRRRDVTTPSSFDEARRSHTAGGAEGHQDEEQT